VTGTAGGAGTPPRAPSGVEAALAVWRGLAALPPRPSASPALERARELAAGALAGTLRRHRLNEERFPLTPWEEVGPHAVEGPGGAVEGQAFLGSPPTPPEGSRGRLRPMGEFRVWGYRPWRRWAVWDDAGRRPVAYVAERLDGPAVPQAVPPGSACLPRLAVGAEAHGRLEHWRETGAEVTVRMALARRAPAARGVNLVAWPPEAPRVVVGAHLDTVPTTSGAYDNAAGVALLLAVAASLPAAVADTTAFVLFDGEEAGLLGSEAFCAAHAGALATASFVNLDGVGRGEVLEAWIWPEALDEVAVAAFEDGRPDPLRLEVKFPPPPASDHMAFVARAVPSIMWTVDDQAVIHTARDTADPRMEANVRRLVPVVASTVRRLSQAGRGGDAGVPGHPLVP
jgi:hypothetical protein